MSVSNKFKIRYLIIQSKFHIKISRTIIYIIYNIINIFCHFKIETVFLCLFFIISQFFF